MNRTFTGSIIGALLALAVTASGAAAAAGPKVTVRVEGKSRTLLAPTLAQTRSGWITKGGAPAGACSATSAAGALDAASRHQWSGQFFSSFSDFEIKTILGDTESTTSFYWGFWINNRYSSSGVCSTKLHRGDSLLFAVDSVAHHEHPLKLLAPKRVTMGKPFTVKVQWLTDAGVAKRSRGATVFGDHLNARTDNRGAASLTATHKGTLILRATQANYIRAATVRVTVAP